MLFAIRFTNNPAALPVREKYLSAHIEWLKQNNNVVKAAGSLREKDNDRPVGALWVIVAADKEEALNVFATDPFNICKVIRTRKAQSVIRELRSIMRQRSRSRLTSKGPGLQQQPWQSRSST